MQTGEVTDSEAQLAEERLEIVEAMIEAHEDWERVSDLISRSADVAEARAALQAAPYSFSEIQVEYVLGMSLRSRTGWARDALASERAALLAMRS